VRSRILFECGLAEMIRDLPLYPPGVQATAQESAGACNHQQEADDANDGLRRDVEPVQPRGG
jgi:hypothetical protein